VNVADTRAAYDAAAEAYAAHVAGELDGKPLDRALLAVLLELAGDGTVADIGCGPGHVTAAVGLSGARVVGLDLSTEMCRLGAAATSLPFCAADMTALPVRPSSLAAIVSWYAVIHLDDRQRAAAYREFCRVLRPAGHALIAFHTADQEIRPGGQRVMTQWLGEDVALTFRFLDPLAEVDALRDAGLTLVARLDRPHVPEVEYPSERSYLLVRR
jgi:SAM-dependent methyltransferase